MKAHVTAHEKSEVKQDPQERSTGSKSQCLHNYKSQGKNYQKQITSKSNKSKRKRYTTIDILNNHINSKPKNYQDRRRREGDRQRALGIQIAKKGLESTATGGR